MKTFLHRVSKYKFVLVLLLIIFVVSLILGICNIWNFSGFWLNLSTDSLTLIATLFVIDFLLEKRKQLEWHVVNETANKDLDQLTNMLTSYMAAPLGLTVMDYEPRVEGNLEERSSDLLSQMLDDLRRRLEHLIDNMNIEQWERMHLNLLFLKSAIANYLAVYQTATPPNVLGELLRLRRAFNSFYSSFGMLPELFIKNEQEWPHNRGGIDNSREIRSMLLESFKKDLRAYFTELVDLKNERD